MWSTLLTLLMGSLVGVLLVVVVGTLLLALLACRWPDRSAAVAEVLKAYAKVLSALRRKRCSCGKDCDGDDDQRTKQDTKT